MRICLLVVFCFCCFVSVAQFKFLAAPKDSASAYYYKSNTLKRGKSRIENLKYTELWLKRTCNSGKMDVFRKNEIAKRKEHKLKVDGYKDYTYSLMRWQFSCETKKCRIIQSLDYNSKGVILDSFLKKDLEVDWDTIDPASMAEKVMEFVCRAPSAPAKK